MWPVCFCSAIYYTEAFGESCLCAASAFLMVGVCFSVCKKQSKKRTGQTNTEYFFSLGDRWVHFSIYVCFEAREIVFFCFGCVFLLCVRDINILFFGTCLLFCCKKMAASAFLRTNKKQISAPKSFQFFIVLSEERNVITESISAIKAGGSN